MDTIADVYIVESLRPNDEGKGRFEGIFLSHLLRLHGKNPLYRYVRTQRQFERAIKDFGNSRYRYLHISAHGDADGIRLTNNSDIDLGPLADILKPHAKRKRLFFSSCAVLSERMAKKIIPSTLCTSIVGPTGDIDFDDSAIVWAAIYHLVFSKDSEKISRTTLLEKLRKSCDLFDVNFAFYSKDKANERGFTGDLLAKDDA